jgi:hypothetical protein
MAVHWHQQPDGKTRISRDFVSPSAAQRGASLLESVCDEAFQPVPQPSIDEHNPAAYAAATARITDEE